MPEEAEPRERSRRVVCAGCQGLFDATDASEGVPVTCPHCGDEVHVGPPRRSRRRVRRTHAQDEALPGDEPDLEGRERIDAPPPALRLLTQAERRTTEPGHVRCAGCDGQFAAPHREAGSSVRCPLCGDEIVLGEAVREKRRVRRSLASPVPYDLTRPYAGKASCAACSTVFVVAEVVSGDAVTCPHCHVRLLAGPVTLSTHLADPRAAPAARGRRLWNVIFVLCVLVLLAAAFGWATHYEYIDWFSRPEAVPR